MIRISESAQKHFRELLQQQEEGTNIRVFVVNPGLGSAECGVSYCPPASLESDDIILPFNGFDAVVDEVSAPFLEDAEIDFVEQEMGSQLTLKAPNAKAKRVDSDAPLIERVDYVVQNQINPMLASHGGQLVVLKINEEGVVYIQFGGGCNGCAMVDVTLKQGVEKELLDSFPGELTGVFDATDHEAGEHSYY